jgi:hypothetical protein
MMARQVSETSGREGLVIVFAIVWAEISHWLVVIWNG